jgi:OTU domain-containing protein 7
VFVLAQIIQRPIVIVSDTVLHDSNGDPLAPIPFGGIYLPLECDKGKCYSYPILLTYDSAHFSALVLMNDENSAIKQNDVPYPIIPITYSTMDLLTIHFSYDPGKDFNWHKLHDNFPNELSRNDNMYILQDYLRLVKIELHNESTVSMANIRVDKPTSYVTYQVDNKTKQKAKNTKLQKFLNIFKRDAHSPSTKINEKYNMQKISSKSMTSHTSAVRKQQKKSRTCMPLAAIESNTTCNFKNWDLLFDSLSPNTTILAAQLNLNKPPKYERIVDNYISSAKDKYLHILQLEKQQARRSPTIAQLPPPPPQQYQQVTPNHNSHINGNYQNLGNMPITPKCAFYNCNRPVDYRYSKTLCQNCAINVYHDEMR